MGLMDLFDKEKRAERAYEKTARRLLNRNAQHDERMAAIGALAEYANDGRDGALQVIFQRFELSADKPTEDLTEREFASDVLAEFGDRTAKVGREYLKVSKNITWPVKVLRRVADDTVTVDILLDALTAVLDKDTFQPERKNRLIELLSDFDDERIQAVVARALEDFDESVRFQATETLFLLADERAREPLLDLLTNDDEESDRIRQRILRGLAELGWPVTGYRKAVEALLEEGQRIDRSGRIRQTAEADS
jgi:hypothetical protein